MTPPEIGIAAVSSPNTAPIGSKNRAPIANAIIAATGPPPRTIQSPTKRTQPVPMIAPNPIVKKFHKESVFCIPPVAPPFCSDIFHSSFSFVKHILYNLHFFAILCAESIFFSS